VRLEGLLEVPELADGADDADAPRVVHREARRVVAPILEPPEPIEEDGGALLVTDVANDAAHVPVLPRNDAPAT
jgi:hypothetical protein